MGQAGSTHMMHNQQHMMSDQQLQLEAQARILRARQHPHLSAQPRSASMGSIPLNQQPPAYQFPYGTHPGHGPRPNGMSPFTASGTPVPSNWQMAFQTEMPPAFLNYYHPGKAHPYFDHTRRNLAFPYPMGTKDLGDRPGEPFTFGFLPDSIYYDPANDRRHPKNAAGDGTNLPGPSTSKASPKKRGAAGTAAGGAKKQRRTNSDVTDDARFVQPYPPNMTAVQQQQRLAPGTVMYATTFDGFTQPSLPLQQQSMLQQQTPQPHMQLQRQMSAPAYSGLAQSAQDAMQNARHQQAIANAQAQYAAQQQALQQQVPSSSSQMDYQQSANGGDALYSEMQWRGQQQQYAQQSMQQQQQPTTPTASSSSTSSQPMFRSPQPSTPQQQAFNNGGAQQQASQQSGATNEQIYWNQQQ